MEKVFEDVKFDINQADVKENVYRSIQSQRLNFPHRRLPLTFALPNQCTGFATCLLTSRYNNEAN